METLLGKERARILIEALPFIQEYENQIVVIKYGGQAMIDDELKQAVMDDLLLLQLVGIHPVLVHGGGKEISRMLEALNIESRFEDGYRVTSKEAMEIVEMILCGKVNKELVSLLSGKGIGLSGLDGNLALAVPKQGSKGQSLGYVGQIEQVDPKILLDLIDGGYIPVIASVAKGVYDNHSYNINADDMASQIAKSLHAKKLILLSDIKGLMRDMNDETSLIEKVRVSQVPALIKEGIISGGMIPKIDCAVEAVRNGSKATILDGRVPHSILIELFSMQGEGTEFSA